MNNWLTFKKQVRRLPVIRSLIDTHVKQKTTCLIVSYPKSGRTWLRILTAKTVALHWHDTEIYVTEPNMVASRCNQSAYFWGFTHEQATNSIASEKAEHLALQPYYQRKKILLLLRDPRDVIVSYFYHRTHRMNETNSLSDFIRHPLWGIERTLNFMERWLTYGPTLPYFHQLTYEDLYQDTQGTLAKVISFYGLNDIPQSTLSAAVAYAHIDNLRALSKTHFKKNAFRPTDTNNPNSHKFRKGGVGGFQETLSPTDRQFINEKLHNYPLTAKLYPPLEL